MNDDQVGYQVSDDVWARVVQLVQLAMLTGTDIVDHLRQLKLRLDESTKTYVLGEGQNEAFDAQIKEFLAKIDS